MTIPRRLAELLAQGVELWADGETLRCRAEPGILTSAHRHLLSERKAEIVALLGQRRKHAVPSCGQERLLFLHELGPCGAAYHIPVITRLRGRLAVAALEASWSDLVARHDSLRTAFTFLDAQPVQVVADDVDPSLPLADLRGLPAAARERAARRLATAMIHRPFDLRRGPLWKVALLRLGREDHLLLIVLHHTIADGWSTQVLRRELRSLYQARSTNRSASLAEPAIQYTDFARWQRQWLRSEAPDVHLGYWRDRLGTDLPTLSLPTDRPRPAVASYRGATQAVAVPPRLHEALEALGRQRRASLFVTLLAAFMTLLHRLTRQRDVVVGSPTANRNRDEVEGLIGCFVNSLVLRGSFAPRTPGKPIDFLVLLDRIRDVVLEALDHQDLPFEKLVEALAPSRDPGRPPLFQVSFALHDAPPTLRLPGLELEPVTPVADAARFDLEVYMRREAAGGLAGVIVYGTELFDATSVRRFARRYERLLQTLAEAPRRPLAELPLLAPSERHQLIFEWQSSGPPRSVTPWLTRRLSAQVKRTPEAIAMVYEERTWTYRELDQVTDQLASKLERIVGGGDPEPRIGLYVDRSPEMVTGLLTILKAGCVYVPLDPADPGDRLALLLDEARVSVVLTQARLAPSLPASEAAVTLLDGEGEGGHAVRRPARPVRGESLAYVLHTSGSTGRPKGVLVSHRALVAHCLDMAERYGLTPGDRVLLFAAAGFDVSLEQALVPLLCGAAVVVRPARLWEPRELLEAMARMRWTVVNLPPAYWSELIREHGDEPPPDSLRLVIVGGEEMPGAMLRLWQRSAWSSIRLLNAYGPTEATVTSTLFEPGPEHRNGAATVPVGRPIGGRQLYVLDPAGRPVPVGVAAELHLGGAALARGYLRRPAATAEKFVPHPFSDEPGGRLYKTGDRGRHLADGNVEFLGRLDRQLEIRGLRVEPGEIEGVLGEHPWIRHCVVVRRQVGLGGPQLVAYVVPEQTPAKLPVPELTECLSSYLEKKLPAAMVPSGWVLLASLPRTPRGKVDHAALPAPERERADAAPASAPPRTALEERLIEIWSQLLGRGGIGVDDNFFALGGHSLLALRMVSRVREHLGRRLDLGQVFERPTVAQVARYLETVAEADSSPPLLPGDRRGELPLSFAQERLWFLDQLEPGSPAYNIPSAWRLDGPLQRAALEASVAEIVRRHEVLRTRFPSADGKPRQEIAAGRPLALPLVNLAGLPPKRRRDEGQRLIGREAARPFSLARGPLLRVTLVRLGGERHLFLRVVHHIVSDQWSEEIFHREIGALYAAATSGRPSPLAKLPVQYADFASWQRRRLRGETLRHQLSYWRRQLSGQLPPLQLSTDRPRGAVRGSRAAYRTRRLDADLTGSLRRLSLDAGASLFMTTLAAFMILLARLTPHREIVVGSPIANRTRHETEEMIGFFVNTLVLRGDLTGNPSFRRFLERVRATVLEAYAHPDLPFEKLVEELHPVRHLERNPLFQVMFDLLQRPFEPFGLVGLSASRTEVPGGVALFEPSLSVADEGDHLVAALVYDAGLFDSTTILRLLSHFDGLLRSFTADPERRLLEASLWSAAERHQVVVEWSRRRPAGRGLSFQLFFEARAAAAPEALAVIDAATEQELTYAQLNRRANRLAHFLKRRGVGPEVRVSVMMERSCDLVVVLLGILKAGGAYVPLDPAYPDQRLDFMAKAAGVAMRITDRILAEAPLEAETSDNPPLAAPPQATAYVIYTSGSSGWPKGVAVTHGSLAWYCLACGDLYGFAAGERILQFSPLSFDISVEEIFPSLASGATLVLRDEPMAESAEAFLAGCHRGSVTWVSLPTAFWHELAAALTADPTLQVPALNGVIVGGERVVVEHLAAWRRAVGPSIRLINTYGPTETTVVATAGDLTCRTEPPDALPSIGRPIPGARVYVLDRQLRNVPVRAVGEIGIAGAGVARGYFNQPAATARRFVPNPFAAELPGDRLYRSGDLGRFRADGLIEILGRVDGQVKIRGFRVEPGEIEAALAAHPDVREAAVIALEQQLAAFVTAAQGTSTGPLIQELRRSLQEKLPRYMIPSILVALPSLPRTPTGKVDQSALAAKARERTSGTAGTERSPRTADEEILLAVWSQLLEREDIGIHDDFFELGGHSLNATRLLARVRRIFRLEIPLRGLFEGPTVAELAASFQTARRSTAPPLVAVPREDELPLSFAQRRLWFLEQLEPGSAAYNMPSAFRLEGELDAVLLERALREIVRRHEILRTRFLSSDGRPRQVISEADLAYLPRVDLTGLAPPRRRATARHLVDSEAARPFDLARGPLLRPALLRLIPGEHVLILHLHHIISDGWSHEVLSRELTTLYQALSPSESEPAALPKLEIQYADFALWQREWLRGERLEELLAYWKRHLAGSPSHLDLPTDRPRPAVRSFHGERRPFGLRGGVYDGLRRLARSVPATLFMTLLAAFQTLLARYTQSRDLCVGTAIAGRNRLETEPLIGFFVNTLPLRCELDDDRSFSELLESVREVALGAYQHQDLPFEKLVEELQPERYLGSSPFFQVFLVLQSTPAEPPLPPGLTVQPLDIAFRRTKFDLSLSCLETPGELRGELVYSQELFDASTVQRLCRHLENLLAEIVADPSRRLCDLSFLGRGERHQLVVEAASPETDAPREAWIHHLFAAQVARSPDAVALVFAEQSLTYRELDRRATLLARRLREEGVGPEVPVALSIPRSPDMAVAILAVLKAGAAYVALDLRYPEAHALRLLSDVRAPLLLTVTALCERFSSYAGTLLCLDRQGPPAAEPGGPDPSPRHLAYATYTSGSTGAPKAVLVAHRGVVAYLDFLVRRFRLGRDDVVLQIAPLSFDMSVRDLIGPLVAGARVVLVSESAARDPAALLASVEEHRVTCWLGIVPSLLASCLDEASRGAYRLDSVRLVVVGGESLLRVLGERARDAFGDGTEVVNHYGTSESYGALSHALTDFHLAGETVPVGRPNPHTSVLILDRRLCPVALGSAGELCVGGASLARGYFQRPGLTARRFVPDPFSTQPGERLYRTGDLARYRNDGNLEVAGRIDRQIKLRGFRIEPGEIEASLLRHPAVREVAVVMSDRGAAGERRLVAFFVAGGEPAPQSGELRRLLERQLPDYMIPGRFLRRRQLPLNRRSKVDRTALSRETMEHEPPEGPAGALVAPRDPIEEMVAEVWAGLLDLDRVGAHDDFFELGGHSLLATRVIARLRRSFQVELAVRSLFENQTVAKLASHLREALKRGSRVAMAPLKRVRRDREIPLSFAQQRLWFLHQLEPASPAYNVQGAFRLEGPLDTAALEGALREIVRRHEVLRTTLPSVEGVARQRIATNTCHLMVVDLGKLSPQQQQSEVRRRLAQETRSPYELTRDRPLRLRLLRLSPRLAVLALGVHHVAWDGWSQGIFHRELTALYDAGSRRQPSPLPELAIQYADFSCWQREAMSGKTLKALLAYWCRQLMGLSPLEVPLDRPRPAMQTFAGASCGLQLRRDVSAALKHLSQERGTSLFMTLLAAWMTLLYRHSPQRDIAVGSPIANRNHEELGGLIGCLVNTLVFRGDLSGHPRFSELLEQVREVTLEAYTHQDLPFEQLVDELAPVRDLSRHALFQVSFALHNAPHVELRLRGLKIEAVETGPLFARFELDFHCWETGTGTAPGALSGVLLYNTDLFDGTTIARFVRHFENLLSGIVTLPESRLSGLPLLASSERHQLLVERNASGWHPTLRAAGEERIEGFHQRFELWAERTPDAVAVTGATATLSYRELEQRANRLARYLGRRGCGPETVVGLSAERSPEMVVALLGILKAGAAYLPLDPSLPERRLSYMLTDSGASLLLTRRSLAGPPGLGKTLQRVDLDADDPAIASCSDMRPPRRVRSSNLAYVIYTSGSTGQPKGVAVTHGAVINFLQAMARRPGLTERDVLLSVTTLSFDIAVLELFLPLVTGARVAIVPRTVALDGLRLARALDESRATVMQATPATWRLLLESDWPGRETLRVFCGGEALPGALADELRRRCASVCNLYGPTETTIWSTVAQVEAVPGPGPAALGQPIANTRIYLLDRCLEPVPGGAVGELTIAGTALARGYLGRGARTAESFVPHPFGTSAGERLYRTGDLARHGADGELLFLGRADHQVKVRGFRIEPGEIEAALEQHPTVREAVVETREARGAETDSGHPVLVAHVVPRGGVEAAQERIPRWRSYLQERLPAYMVPAVFMLATSLPRLPNGKVDRRRLPAPEATRPELESGYVAPRTATEKALVAIWADVLGPERVGVDDDFFALGGDSILSIRIVARAHRRGLHLSPKDLFQHPTVAELARLALHPAPAPTSVERQAPLPDLPLTRVDRRFESDAEVEGVFPVSPAQQDMFSHWLHAPGSQAYLMQISYEIEGALDVAAFRQAWRRLMDRHSTLRTSLLWEGLERPLQVVHRHLELPWEERDWRFTREHETLAAYLRADRARGFDLTRPPLTRFTLLRLADERWFFTWSYHHVILDGWSTARVLGEVLTLYRGLWAGREVRLPPTVAYREYLAWLESQDAAGAETFWRQALRGLTSPSPLPFDRQVVATPDDAEKRGERRVALSETVTAELDGFARRHRLTLNTLVQAAWALVLGRYGDEEDVLFGVTHSGRPPEVPGIESMVGLFINSLPLRVSLKPAAVLLPWLREIQSWNAAMRHYGYSQLFQVQEWSGLPPGRLAFDSLLMFENYPLDAAALDPAGTGLTFKWVGNAAHTSLPLDLVAVPGASLQVRLSYDSRRFDATSIARLAGAFRTLLEGFAARPSGRLAELCVLSRPQRHQVVVEWNDTAVHEVGESSVVALFEAQVERAPEAVAVISQETRLSYRELDHRARRLSHRLRHLGVGPETLVAIYLARSPEAVVALLGVLKAGAAYLPLDLLAPHERLAWILEETATPVVLTQRDLADALPETSARHICLDLDEAVARPPPAGGEAPHESPAYVIYTSGSTGRPKGVVVTRRALATYVETAVDELALRPGDRVLQFAALSFDTHAEEIFPCLAAGATLVLRTEEMLESPAAFLAACQESEVSVLDLPTAYWHELTARLGEIAGGLPHTLRLVVIGGESARPERLAEWRQHAASGIRLLNTYGPSEATVVATARTLRDTVTLGSAIRNVRSWVLDRRGTPAPLGAVGELCIGGVGLARGYLRRPALTAERFCPDPFSHEPGSRLYRSADRVRWLPDGNLEFLGRLDHQVKILGRRIELGEIEAALGAHPAVEEAVVLARPSGPGVDTTPQLVAYVVPRGDQEPPPPRNLRRFLRSTLPAYMVPAALVLLEALPRTASGKADRAALGRRSLPPSRLDTDRPSRVPRSSLEDIVTRVFGQVLGREHVGVDDDFFELGGSSLQLIQLMFRLRRTLQVELPLRRFFDSPSAAGLAAALAASPPRQAAGVSPGDLPDLEAEAVLDPRIVPETSPAFRGDDSEATFLTGATGFLGAFLLHELLRTTSAKIHCLVRCAHVREGRRRIRENLVTYRLWHDVFDARIIPVPGDLSQPLLALSERDFSELARRIDVIYHLGAWVNFIYSYSMLKATNVAGTQEVLRLACRGSLKVLHHASTFGVFESPGCRGAGAVDESDTLAHGKGLEGGYNQSKWVAEKLVREAGARGLPVCIYRFGTISGDSRTGVGTTEDFASRIIKSYIELGMAPAADTTIRLTPVDHLVRAIGHLSKQEDSPGQTFHIANPHPLDSRHLTSFMRSLGYPLERVPYERWTAALTEYARSSAESPLAPFLSLIEPPVGDDVPAPRLRIESSHTRKLLEKAGIACPAIGQELLSAYFSYFRSRGFLSEPPPMSLPTEDR